MDTGGAEPAAMITDGRWTGLMMAQDGNFLFISLLFSYIDIENLKDKFERWDRIPSTWQNFIGGKKN